MLHLDGPDRVGRTKRCSRLTHIMVRIQMPVWRLNGCIYCQCSTRSRTGNALYADHIRQRQCITERWQYWQNVRRLYPKCWSTDLLPIRYLARSQPTSPHLWIWGQEEELIFNGSNHAGCCRWYLIKRVRRCQPFYLLRARACPMVLLFSTLPSCYLIARDETSDSDQ